MISQIIKCRSVTQLYAIISLLLEHISSFGTLRILFFNYYSHKQHSNKYVFNIYLS